MIRRRIALAAALVVAFAGGACVASAAGPTAPDTYRPPCTANTDTCRQQRIAALEAHYRQHVHPTATASPSPSATLSPSATISATPSPSATSASPTVSPSPTASPSGFPDASTTGHRGTLTAYTGSSTIIADGTVLDGKKFTGQITVEADNVTIRNSWLDGSGNYGFLVWGKNFTLVDSTVTGRFNTASITGYSDQGGGDLHLLRVDGSGGVDIVRMGGDGNTVQDSYFHDICRGSSDCPGAHNDTVGVLPGTKNTKIIHNTILNADSQTSAVEIGDTRSPQSTGELRGNLIGGGGYTVYAMGASNGQGWTVDGNRFTTRYYPKAGYWGPVNSWSAGAGNVWTNNAWADGPNAGSPVNP